MWTMRCKTSRCREEVMNPHVYLLFCPSRQPRKSMRRWTTWRWRSGYLSEMELWRTSLTLRHLRVWTGGRTAWSVRSRTRWAVWKQQKETVSDDHDKCCLFLRVIVAPAGPSALWELWRVRWRRKPGSLFPWARRTWWTAAPVMVTWAAGEGTSPNPTATSSATPAWTRRAFILTNTRSSFHSNNAHDLICISSRRTSPFCRKGSAGTLSRERQAPAPVSTSSHKEMRRPWRRPWREWGRSP